MTEWLPEWLFEGQLTVYVLLAAALVFLLVIWKQTPRRAYLVACVAVVALLGIYFLLDFFVETDREQVTHAFREMSAGVQGRSVDRIFSQVSESYNRRGASKAAFRQDVAGPINGQQVDRVAIWGFEFAPNYKSKESQSAERPDRAEVAFMVKPEGTGGQIIYRIEAVMHRDADGRWRLQSWEAFDPFHNDAKPISVPFLH